MRVALVHDWLTGMRGGEKVLEALAELWPQAPIHTLVHVPGSVSRQLESHPIHTSFLQRFPGVGRRYRALLPLFPAAVEDFDLTAFDLVVSTSHCVAKGAIPGPDAVHLCYCHTPMRYAWDQEHTYFPRRRGASARLRNLALTALRAWDVATVPRVDAFLANSRFVARRIRRYYGRDAEVVPPPVDVGAFSRVSEMSGEHAIVNAQQRTAQEQKAQETPPRAPDAGYALVVSALAPYKRVDVALAACARLGLELRVVGTGSEQRRLRSLAGPGTRLLGHVDGDALRALYHGAQMFLQPGVEDFGIASVEALASGVPVVARGRGGVVDVVDDGVHGVLYDGESAADLAAAIDKARGIRFNTDDLINRARSFTKARFIERIRSCVSRYVATPRGDRGGRKEAELSAGFSEELDR